MEALEQFSAAKSAASEPIFNFSKFRTHSIWWFFAAIALGFVIYQLVPDEYSARNALRIQTPESIKLTLAATASIILLWCTRPIPIFLTSLLPIVLFPLFHILPLNKILPAYASEYIFSVGCFLILGAALHKWKLDRRIALWIVYLFGPKKSHILWGTMMLTTFASMWMPNGELGALLLPVAIAICSLVEEGEINRNAFNFRTLLFCGLCAGICVGGMTMIIGSPINGVVVRFIRSVYETRIGHLLWLMIGIPIFTIALPFLCLTISHLLSKDVRGNDKVNEYYIQHEIDTLPAMHKEETLVLGTVTLTVLACVTSTILLSTSIDLKKAYGFFTHSFIGICSVLFLYSVRFKRVHEPALLSIRDLQGAPWWVLVYVGGAITLADALQTSGAVAFLTSFLIPVTDLSPILAIIVVSVLVFIVTNFLPTVAISGIMLTFFSTISVKGGLFTEDLIIICTLVASASFLFPLASVGSMFFFSTGAFTFRQFFRFGAIVSCVIVPICILIPVSLSFFLYDETKFEPATPSSLQMEGYEKWHKGRISRFYDQLFYSGPSLKYEE